MASTQILVVEDEGIVAKAIQTELQDMGYDVPTIAASGKEAIEKAEHSQPDLVLMDISLKGDMDGIEAAREIKTRCDIPVVYLSAYEDETILGRAKTTEPYGYLLKPYEERELRTTIEMALYKHRMEKRLKETERWLAATLESIDDAVIATDSRHCIRFMNPVAEGMCGWDRQEAFGKDLPEVCTLVHAETREALDNLAARSLREGVGLPFGEQSVLLGKHGQVTPVEGSVAPINDEEGYFTGVVMVFRDISQRQRLEMIQRQSDEHLRQSQKMAAISRLAGGIAHDFNNLLTAILGNTEIVLASLSPNDPDRELLARVETASLRAAELVEQLLSFSGRTKLFCKPIILNETIDGMLEILRRMIDPHIQLDFKPGPNLWAVQADPAQINELLVNLCLNGQDAMPTGGLLTLESDNIVTDMDYLLTHPEARPGDYVRLRVTDTGKGIKPEARERIYEPFFSTSESKPNNGLGMALVYGIVEQHHGWIDCSTKPGQGSHFDIFLPRQFERVEIAEAAPPSSDAAPVAPAPGTGQPAILLADDDPMVRELGRTILQAEGYEVLLAEDGLQAVEAFQRDKDRIDLVILDLTMPKMCGDTAFRQMLESKPNLKGIFSSGYFAEDLTTGDDRILGFINKPYRYEDLAGMVRAALCRD